MFMVPMAERLARRIPDHKIVGSSPAKKPVGLSKTIPRGLLLVTMMPRFTQP